MRIRVNLFVFLCNMVANLLAAMVEAIGFCYVQERDTEREREREVLFRLRKAV